MSCILSFRRLAPALALFLFLTPVACMQSSHEAGRPILDEKVSQIVKGQTTSAQILEMFGTPTSQSTMADHTLYVYRHSIDKGSGLFLPYYGTSDTKENADELTITFDAKADHVLTYSLQRGIKQ